MPRFFVSRRALLVSALSLAALPAYGEERFAGARARLARLEARLGGRVGVAIRDTGGAALSYRGDERFALCSTFKWLAAAFVLARVDRREEDLARRVRWTKSELQSYSPVTRDRTSDGMTVGALCEAMVTQSDNTAANLMLASFGGPSALTAFLRGIGDETTRLDRDEPSLNEAAPGDPRDTTTPDAMVATLGRIVLGEVLSDASRRRLVGWLVANQTGDTKIRAGVPRGWIVGDKTGSGRNGAWNDVAVLWPPGRKPVLVAAYLAESSAKAAAKDAVLADIGRIASAG